MRPSHIEKALTSLIAARHAVMIWGPPGVGKSQLVKKVADKMFGPLTVTRVRSGSKRAEKTLAAPPYANGHFIDLRLPLLDAVDLRGIPTVVDGRTVWIPPSFLPRDGNGVMFFDEIVQATPSMQASASSIILPPHTLGEYTLPSGWAIVAAGNRETDRAATHKMPSHLANRFTHLNYDVHLEDWVTWALQHDVEPAVIAFLNFRPELLHKFDPAVKAFPTPRSWEFVSHIMKQGVDDECFLETISGTVGEGAATEFTGFFRVFRSLPDYEDIVAHPDKATVPDNAAALYAVSGMITGRGESKHAKPLFQYVERLPKDFQVLVYRDITKRNIEMAESQGYINWTVKNQAILLNR
jgi:MoxR-like ATPase